MFDTSFYLENNRDVAEAQFEPLAHYLEFGWKEGRNPHPFFSTRWYLKQAHLNEHSEINPLTHYLTIGRAMGLLTSPDHNPPNRPIAFLADATFPRKDRDAGSVYQLALIDIFQSFGFDVHFFAHGESHYDVFGDSQHCVHKLKEAGVHCIAQPRNCVRYIDYLYRYGLNVSVAVLSREVVAYDTMDVVRELCPKAKIVFNTVDLHHVRERRQGAVQNDPSLIARSYETEEREISLIDRADLSLVVSTYEEFLLKKDTGTRRLRVFPLIAEVSERAIPSFGSRSGVAFIGNYRHPPNVDAVETFLSDIWPAIHAARKEIKLYIVGSDLPDRIRKRNDAGVIFVGYVEDINTFLDTIKLTVAPLRFGAGAKGKLLTSMARGVPCVASTIAAEGMLLENDVEIAIASEPDQYLSKILDLYDNEPLWSQYSSAGFEAVLKRHSLNSGRALLKDILRQLDVTGPEI